MEARTSYCYHKAFLFFHFNVSDGNFMLQSLVVLVFNDFESFYLFLFWTNEEVCFYYEIKEKLKYHSFTFYLHIFKYQITNICVAM